MCLTHTVLRLQITLALSSGGQQLYTSTSYEKKNESSTAYNLSVSGQHLLQLLLLCCYSKKGLLTALALVVYVVFAHSSNILVLPYIHLFPGEVQPGAAPYFCIILTCIPVLNILTNLHRPILQKFFTRKNTFKTL